MLSENIPFFVLKKKKKKFGCYWYFFVFYSREHKTTLKNNPQTNLRFLFSKDKFNVKVINFFFKKISSIKKNLNSSFQKMSLLFHMEFIFLKTWFVINISCFQCYWLLRKSNVNLTTIREKSEVSLLLHIP